MSARRMQGGHEWLANRLRSESRATFGGDGQVHATALPHRILLANSFFDQVGIEQPEYCEPLLNRSVRQVTVVALQADQEMLTRSQTLRKG